jgi:hypothetical protein
MIETLSESNYNGEPFEATRLTDIGWDWIDKNDDRFVVRRDKQSKRQQTDELFDDDIPF